LDCGALTPLWFLLFRESTQNKSGVKPPHSKKEAKPPDIDALKTNRRKIHRRDDLVANERRSPYADPAPKGNVRAGCGGQSGECRR